MSREERDYPVRSLHDFLAELEEEWSNFRTGSLLGVAASVILFLFVVRIILRNLNLFFAVRRLPPVPLLLDVALPLLAAVALAYSGYSLYRQYNFFQRWERRLSLLLHLERRLLEQEDEGEG